MPPRRIAPPSVSWPGTASAQAKPGAPARHGAVLPPTVRSGHAPPPFAPLHDRANPPRPQPAAQAKPASVIQPMRSVRESTKKQTEQLSQPPSPQTKRLSRRNSVSLENGSFEIGMDVEPVFKVPQPKYPPQYDQFGNRLLRFGKRSEVSWLNGFLDWYWKNKQPVACQSTEPTLHNNNDIEIDHIRSFFKQIAAECVKHPVCDGSHHWDAYVIDFHTEKLTAGDIDSNGRNKNSVRRAYHLRNNLQWMCQPHNGSKNGTKDHDSLAEPDYLGPCDGKSCSDPAP
ncbi:MAG TPA: hypothetical protein VKQ29_08795 [Aliidongia sp.]|nr:hypothetical protein [Aliidongia sp.]